MPIITQTNHPKQLKPSEFKPFNNYTMAKYVYWYAFQPLQMLTLCTRWQPLLLLLLLLPFRHRLPTSKSLQAITSHKLQSFYKDQCLSQGSILSAAAGRQHLNKPAKADRHITNTRRFTSSSTCNLTSVLIGMLRSTRSSGTCLPRSTETSRFFSINCHLTNKSFTTMGHAYSALCCTSSERGAQIHHNRQ